MGFIEGSTIQKAMYIEWQKTQTGINATPAVNTRLLEIMSLTCQNSQVGDLFRMPYIIQTVINLAVAQISDNGFTICYHFVDLH